jgi:hypothetical protein
MYTSFLRNIDGLATMVDAEPVSCGRVPVSMYTENRKYFNQL